jgi:TPR repeat protein
MCFRNGFGVDVNPQKSFYFAKLAARSGSAEVYAYLGFCYSNAFGCSRSITRALFCTTQAADNGNIQSQYNLGIDRHMFIISRCVLYDW